MPKKNNKTYLATLFAIVLMISGGFYANNALGVVGELDADSDGVIDSLDNCPNTPNADQADSNSNGIGDACEAGPTCTDSDSDTFSTEGGACGTVDCNDGNATIYPGAALACVLNDVDYNCDGVVDCPAGPTCTDADGDTYSAEGGACGTADCNDGDATIYPTAPLLCTQSDVDYNCDAVLDCVTVLICTDNDFDFYSLEGGDCGPIDCNDTNAAIFPGTEEICNGADNNCDGVIDCQAGGACTDNDSDFFSAEGGACGPIDCNDNDANIFPDAEQVCNGLDNDCDGILDCAVDLGCTDVDGDNYYNEGGICGQIDCNDAAIGIFPGANQICNGLDNDCDGAIDCPGSVGTGGGGGCGCAGKVDDLTLQYNGASSATITVVMKKDDIEVFNGVVASNGQFSFQGADNNGTFGSKIFIYVNGVLNGSYHTSCSESIGAGTTAGDFTVVTGGSRNLEQGLCPFTGPQPTDDDDDDYDDDGINNCDDDDDDNDGITDDIDDDDDNDGITDDIDIDDDNDGIEDDEEEECDQDDGGNIYAFRGDNHDDFWMYDVSADQWTSKQDAPNNVKHGGSLVSVGGDIYAFRGDNKDDFWMYDVSADQWSSMEDAPEKVKDGAALVEVSGDLYAFRGNNKDDFWMYDVSADQWSSMEDAPEKVNAGGAMTNVSGDIYAFRGFNKDDFWMYDVSADQWSSMEDTPDNVQHGGSLVGVGVDIYAFRGDNHKDFWKYTVSSDQWSDMEDAPENVKHGGALVNAGGGEEVAGGEGDDGEEGDGDDDFDNDGISDCEDDDDDNDGIADDEDDDDDNDGVDDDEESACQTHSHDDNHTDSVTNSEGEEEELTSEEFDEEVEEEFDENPFSDTDLDELEGMAAAELYNRGAITGINGKFMGNNKTTRAEAIKMTLEVRFDEIPTVDYVDDYSDVQDGQWYTNYILVASQLNIVEGYDNGTFRPNNNINTAEFLKVLSLTFDLERDLDYDYEDVDEDAWYATYAGVANTFGLFPGRDDELDPEDDLTRTEIVIAVYNYLVNR